jgi:hypothetical protein
VRQDDPGPGRRRWRWTERQENWLAVAVCLLSLVVLLAAIVLAYNLGLRWLV